MTKVQRLIKSGYRCISNRHRQVSRIDCEDWQTRMAKEHSPWCLSDGIHWVRLLGSEAGDHYRRCYSKDVLTVSYSDCREIRQASRLNEYLPLIPEDPDA